MNRALNYSVVPATVTSNDDDQHLGRVKVRFPWMTDSDESGWIAVMGAGAGAGGFYYVPEPKDLVLVAFAFGRVDKAYVLGGLWSTADKPPAGGDPKKRTIKSVSGHTITLDDTQNAELISIVDKSGENKITLDAKNKTITIESGGDLTIHAKGALKLQSDQDVTISGQNISAEAQQKASVKGANVAIDGQAGVKLNDGALEVV